MPWPLMRTLVAIAYWLFGLLELLCRPLGILKTTDDFAAEPRASVPLPIDPVTVCAFADIMPQTIKTPAERIALEKTLFINVEVLDAENVSASYFFIAKLSSSSAIL